MTSRIPIPTLAPSPSTVGSTTTTTTMASPHGRTLHRRPSRFIEGTTLIHPSLCSQPRRPPLISTPSQEAVETLIAILSEMDAHEEQRCSRRRQQQYSESEGSSSSPTSSAGSESSSMEKERGVGLVDAGRESAGEEKTKSGVGKKIKGTFRALTGAKG